MKTTENINSVSLVLLTFLFLQFAAVSKGQQPIQPTVETREDFTDEELKLFVKVQESVSEIQTETQERMADVIEREGLTVERFNEILETQQDPDKSAEAAPEELNAFNNAAQVILEENQKAEAEMVIRIEKQGMDIHTYREIMVAYEQSPKVRGRIDQLTEEQNQGN